VSIVEPLFLLEQEQERVYGTHCYQHCSESWSRIWLDSRAL